MLSKTVHKRKHLQARAQAPDRAQAQTRSTSTSTEHVYKTEHKHGSICEVCRHSQSEMIAIGVNGTPLSCVSTTRLKLCAASPCFVSAEVLLGIVAHCAHWAVAFGQAGVSVGSQM